MVYMYTVLKQKYSERFDPNFCQGQFPYLFKQITTVIFRYRPTVKLIRSNKSFVVLSLYEASVFYYVYVFITGRQMFTNQKYSTHMKKSRGFRTKIEATIWPW